MTKRPSLKPLVENRPTAALFALNEAIETRRPKPQPGRVGKKVVTVYLPESVWRDAKVLAAKTDNTIDALMREGLDMVFEKHGVNRGAAG